MTRLTEESAVSSNSHVMFRVAPESGFGSGQNPAFFPYLAKIWLRVKFRQSQMLLLDVKNAHK